jgi:PhnB protein
MKTLRPYLGFDGRCEAALQFYAEAFGGTIKSMQRFGEAPVQAAEKDKARIMHAEFAADGVEFMASDGPPDNPRRAGNSVTLAVMLDDVGEQDRIWGKLSAGGTVTQPLQETFWGARFGMVTDKFGIPWMLNCDLPKKK